MRNNSSLSGNGRPDPLADRVRDRVREAGVTIDRAPVTQPGLSKESLSLRRVFKEMGDTYRLHRRRTGDAVIPEVREAAIAFKRDPNLLSLTAVAAQLEREGLLGW